MPHDNLMNIHHPDYDATIDARDATIKRLRAALTSAQDYLSEEITASLEVFCPHDTDGNIIFERYLKSTKYVKNSLSDEELAKFKATIDLFQKYSSQYDFDWLMMAALAYQESGLDQSVRSPVGAIGVMQVLPSTANDPNVAIPNIEEIEPNIHAGVKYLHFLHHRYFQDPAVDQLNRWLFTFAAYNAGPARVKRLRKEATEMGLDPNIWFRNVEVVAAKRIGRENVQYVSNIYKYFIAYSLIIERMKAKKAAEKKIAQ